jgi:hypothetical protein
MALVGNISGSGGISNTIGITGSLIIANPGLATFPDFPGTDTVFFVSGAIDGKAAGSRTVAVFGGDVVASGSITVGTGSVKLTSNDIQFDGFGTRIEKSGNSLKFFDASNTGGLTLSQLNAGGGGSGTNFFYDNDGNGQLFTTGSTAFVGSGADYANNIYSPADKGADLFFYVSGSTDGTANALFGGDVVTSGSITVRDGGSSLSIAEGATNSTAITATAGDLLLNSLAGNTRVIVQTELEIQGEGIVAGGGGGARGIFTDNATQTNLITIGGVGGKTTVAGELQVTSGYISGSTGVNLTLGSGGDVTVAGGLTVTGNDIKSSTGATAITLSGGNVIIPGDLTVNGTTTTVNTENLTVKDQLIYIASSSAAGTVTYGGLAIASGSGTTNQALVFVKDGTGATSLWSAGRQDVNSGSATTNAGLTYMPVRASSFEMGGTPGSAVAAGSAYLSSSDALNVLVNHTATTTFTKSGTAIVQITDNGGDGMITGNSAIDTIASLWASGSTVNMAHTLSASAGPVPHGIKIVGGGVEGGSLRITTSGATPTLNINAHNGTNQAQALVISGSAVSINAATSNNTNGVLIRGAGTSLARFWGSSTNTEIDLLGTSENVIDGTGNATAELSLSGSNINLKHGVAGGAAVKLARGNTPYGEIQYAPDGGRTYTQFNSILNSSVASNVRIGTAVNGANSGIINLSGSLVEILAGQGAIFQTLGTASGYLTISSGSYVTPAATLANASKIEATVGGNLLLGAQGTTVVSGSGVRFNVAGPGTVAMQSHGTTFLTFASGSGTDNSVTIAPVGATTANLLNTVATTVNFAGAATTLAIATTPTTTQTINLATGVTSTGNTKTINLGTGGAAGSTTNIVLGSTLGGGTITANENLVPGAANTYDLGAVDNRWRNIYTGDLHLKNDRGNWTIVEEAEFLSITNNLSGKRYKFVLEEI